MVLYQHGDFLIQLAAEASTSAANWQGDPTCGANQQGAEGVLSGGVKGV